MEKRKLQTKFRNYLKECSGGKMVRDFSGSEIENVVLNFLEEELKILSNSELWWKSLSKFQKDALHEQDKKMSAEHAIDPNRNKN